MGLTSSKSVSAPSSSSASQNNSNSAKESGATRVSMDMIRELVHRGMEEFKQNMVTESIATFDQVIQLDERKRPYLWQRGLSLYYDERYNEASEQFRLDVAVNPNDTEESIWAFLSESRIHGFDYARAHLLVVGRDSRAVMRCAYELFQGVGTMESLAAAASKNSHDEFYSLLYQGLYYEAKGDTIPSEEKISASLASEYAQKADDYMVSLARIHALRRTYSCSSQ
jgi:tetratricopeptide (TPR) repeat protein